MHESFLRHRDWLYLKVAALLCLAALVAYAWHDPMDGPNGGTWLGYTLGTIGALLIVWLTALGIRKRRYASSLGTVRGWVSAHVYLGLALLLIATLHTGFQFGLNLHALAYVLMVAVIVSGVYGIIAYTRYPRLITENRAQSTREAWLDEVLELNERAIKLADEIGPKVHQFVLQSAEQLRLGGDWREQLFGGRFTGASEVNAIAELLRSRMGKAQGDEKDDQTEGMIVLTDTSVFTTERDPVLEKYKRLLELLTRRNQLANRMNRDVQAHARMQFWLYFHVPMTAALLAALTAHIVTVFLYH